MSYPLLKVCFYLNKLTFFFLKKSLFKRIFVDSLNIGVLKLFFSSLFCAPFIVVVPFFFQVFWANHISMLESFCMTHCGLQPEIQTVYNGIQIPFSPSGWNFPTFQLPSLLRPSFAPSPPCKAAYFSWSLPSIIMSCFRSPSFLF